jgi:hypothetical protein
LLHKAIELNVCPYGYLKKLAAAQLSGGCVPADSNTSLCTLYTEQRAPKGEEAAGLRPPPKPPKTEIKKKKIL